MAKKTETKQAQVAEAAQNNELYAISDYLKKLKFSTAIMGVDEADVWKKIEKLCELYETALFEEQSRNEKLTRQLKACAAKLRQLMPAEKQEDKPNG